MAKPLRQITFDFEEEQGNTATVVPVEEIKKEMKMQPAPVATNKKTSPRGRKSLKSNPATTATLNVPADDVLFNKQYYSIGEVAQMFGENQSLIRYWETEFDILQPRKNRKGDRFFRPVDIKNLVLIYDLLRRRKFTLEGAREYLKKSSKAEERFKAIESLEKIKGFLLELKVQL